MNLNTFSKLEHKSNPNKVYKSKTSGYFVVSEYVNARNTTVTFIQTGTTKQVQSNMIPAGSIKDESYPSMCGVGFIGKGKHRTQTDEKVMTKSYQTWKSMIRRCYSGKQQERQPTYIDCTVCPEWHNYQVFAEWFDKNYIEGFQLDKDIKIEGNKVYSPQTCLFVSSRVNMIKAHAKEREFISPQGKNIKIYNLEEFCRGTDLHPELMGKVFLGKQSHHKGWTKA